MPDIAIITKAAHFAAEAHRGQRRKDDAKTPYFNHVADVANILASHGYQTAIVAAGYLHDTVEDTDVTLETINAEFGGTVALLVSQVTDDKTLPWAERKRLQIEAAKSVDSNVAALKVADKISNLRDITSRPPAHWDQARIDAYIDWSHQVVTATDIKEWDPMLWALYQSVRAELGR